LRSAGKTLDDFRAAVLADKPGRVLLKAIEGLRPTESSGDVQDPPYGFDASHERAGFLLHDGLYADIALLPDAMWPISRWLLAETAGGRCTSSAAGPDGIWLVKAWRGNPSLR
jgi:hypothetical protein